MPINDIKDKLAAIASVDAAAQPLVASPAHAVRGCDLEVTVPPARVTDAARIANDAALMLEAVTGVDWLAEQQMEVVYDYTHVQSGQRLTVRARIPRGQP